MKTIKKAIIFTAAILLVISVVAGCTATPAESESSATEESTVQSENQSESQEGTEEKPEIPPRKKIAVLVFNTDDNVMSSGVRLLESAAEVLNVELVWKVGDTNAEMQVTAVENLIASGIDGIMILPSGNAAIPKLHKLCTEAEVPFIQIYRGIADPIFAAEAEKNPYYLGYTTDNEIEASQVLVEALADNGCKNIAVISTVAGNSTGDLRRETFLSTIEEEGMNLLTEYRLSFTEKFDTQTIEATNNFINTYPELDGIVSIVGIMGAMEGVRTVVESEEVLGKVKVVTFDHPDTDIVGMFERGSFVGMASGAYVDPLYSFIVMYNYLHGTPLSDTPVKQLTNYIYVRSVEDAIDFVTYYNDEVLVYSQEEIKMMTKFYNPDFTIEDLNKIISDYSIEDVKARLETK